MQDEVEVKARELLANAPVTRFIGHDFVPKVAAIRAIAAALRQRPVDHPDFYYRYDRVYGHRVITVSEYESWGRHCRKEDTYSPAYLSPASAQRPVVDDARMARALEWVRDYSRVDRLAKEHLPAIEEAIAAYDPNCGGRTVFGVDDAMVRNDSHAP